MGLLQLTKIPTRISHHISQSLRLCRGAGEQRRVVVQVFPLCSFFPSSL
ncbi:hypothetical protein COO91_05254 [Nostoc flagelliforme CCNUN1]|uniref:Uncharacterized protein n=1 Tax=Nostoc flagelliforme CCNUN1 TaxID=2038116 RepID=A0A2K8SUZ3_9NOSO|nr:hypothetical protein COO91_05254 [Nostoc flagelliforme CCNUN1]